MTGRGLRIGNGSVMALDTASGCDRGVIKARTGPDNTVVAKVARLRRVDVIQWLESRRNGSWPTVTTLAGCWRSPENSLDMTRLAFDAHV